MVDPTDRSAELAARCAILLFAVRDAVLLTDEHGRTTEVNLAAVRLFGRDRSELIGRLPGEVVELSDGKQAEILRQMLMGRPWSGEVRFIRPDGAVGMCEVTVDPVLVDSRLVGTVGICREVTDQRRLASALAEAENRWRLTLDHAPVGVALVGLDGQFQRVNAALCRLVGYPEPELIQLTFQDITHPDDLDADLALLGQLLTGELHDYELEKRYLHASGRVVWIHLSVALVRDQAGEPLHFVAHVQDITERKARTAKLERLASRDELTGLANRTTFGEWLEQAGQQGNGFAVAYLDLDGFKAVNDVYGHAVGDELLRQAAARIAGGLRPEDLPARLGGDEFAVLLPEVTTAADAELIGSRLLAALSDNFSVETAAGPAELGTGVSVGLAVAAAAEAGPVVLARADAAMYAAKAAGTNRCVLG